MRLLPLLSAACLLLLLPPPSFAQAGDAEYGREMLDKRQCASCHVIDGEGDGSAPDLAHPESETLSPAALAAKLWNHAPAMFEGMDAAGMQLTSLSEYDIANYYAWLYSIRYFDPPADIAAGGEIFGEKGCSGCHNLKVDANEPGAGPAVEKWSAMADPVLWAQSLWNHAGAMEAAGAAANGWPTFELQQMVDLLAFVESQPAHVGQLPYLRLGDWISGKRDFDNLQCSQCHALGEDEAGKVDLAAAARRQPLLSGLAVEMWNHRPAMANAAADKGIELPVFEVDQMADIASYLFREGYFQASGDAARGQSVYEEKGCASCHDTGEADAPLLGGWDGEYTGVRFASSVWMHAPNMSVQINFLEKEWPELSEQDVVDLIALINSK